MRQYASRQARAPLTYDDDPRRFTDLARRQAEDAGVLLDPQRAGQTVYWLLFSRRPGNRLLLTFRPASTLWRLPSGETGRGDFRACLARCLELDAADGTPPAWRA